MKILYVDAVNNEKKKQMCTLKFIGDSGIILIFYVQCFLYILLIFKILYSVHFSICIEKETKQKKNEEKKIICVIDA